MNRRKSRVLEDQDDPVVAEVRRWRAKVFKQAGGTLAGLSRLLRNSSAAQPKRKRVGKSAASRSRRNGRRKAA